MKPASISALVLTFAVHTAFAATGPVRAVAPPRPALAFGPHSVTASGFSPGTSVVFFGVGLDNTPEMAIKVQWSRIVEDTGAEGKVTFDLQRNVPVETVWAAVDVRSGEYTMSSPAGAVIEPGDAKRASFHKSQGRVDGLSFPGSSIELLYVQPGGGVWRWEERDGLPSDPDGPNGLVTIQVSHAKSLGQPQAPLVELASGGTLIGVDWMRMTVFSFRIDASVPGGRR